MKQIIHEKFECGIITKGYTGGASYEIKIFLNGVLSKKQIQHIRQIVDRLDHCTIIDETSKEILNISERVITVINENKKQIDESIVVQILFNLLSEYYSNIIDKIECFDSTDLSYICEDVNTNINIQLK